MLKPCHVTKFLKKSRQFYHFFPTGSGGSKTQHVTEKGGAQSKDGESEPVEVPAEDPEKDQELGEEEPLDEDECVESPQDVSWFLVTDQTCGRFHSNGWKNQSWHFCDYICSFGIWKSKTGGKKARCRIHKQHNTWKKTYSYANVTSTCNTLCMYGFVWQLVGV